MASYLPILVFTLVSIGFLVVTLLAARIFRHRGSPNTYTKQNPLRKPWGISKGLGAF